MPLDPVPMREAPRRRVFLHAMGAWAAGCALPGDVLGRPTSVKPRHVLCFLGPWKSLSVVEGAVGEFGQGFTVDRDYSAVESDPRMEKAFAASADRVNPTFTAEDRARVKRHAAVAYVLSPPIEKTRALSVSTAALSLVARLIAKAGATAVKSESAGIAHGLGHWQRLAEAHALRQAWVRRPIRDGDALYSCGMHLLGLPDIECAGGFGEMEAVRWIDAMADSAIGGAQAPAQRFSVDGKAPARRVRPVSCERYAEDDFFFNPHGYLRVIA